MPLDRHSCVRFAAALAILAGVYVLVFHRLADRGLWSSHEARAGSNAAWYLRHPGWGPSILPDGSPELQKPPLSYWLIAGTAWVLGEDHPGPLAIRLPAALAAIGCAGCLVGLGVSVGHFRRGLLAGLLLLTMIHFTWLARIARTDMILALALTAGCCCQLMVSRSAGRTRLVWAVGLAFFSAMGVMTKGPLAMVLLGAVAFALGWVRRGGGSLGTLGLLAWLGLPVAAGAFVCLPWFLLADARTDGRFIHEFFWLHTWGRGMGGTRLREHPWWLYLVQGPVESMPWSLLLIPALAWVWKKRKEADSHSSRDAMDGLAWLAAMLAVLSASRFKRMDYLLPVFPALAWVVACWWEARQRSLNPGRRLMEQRWLVAGLGLVVAGWWVHLDWVLPRNDEWRDLRAMGRSLSAQIPENNNPLFFQLEQHELAYWLNRPTRTVIDWPELAGEVDSDGRAFVVTNRQRLSEGWFVDPGFEWTMVMERDPDHRLSLAARADLVVVQLRRRRPETPVVLSTCPSSFPLNR